LRASRWREESAAKPEGSKMEETGSEVYMNEKR